MASVLLGCNGKTLAVRVLIYMDMDMDMERTVEDLDRCCTCVYVA